MKLQPVPSTLQVTQGQATTMVSKVGAAAALRLAEISVNLYANPDLAAARESLANAVDTSRVSGATRPVNVTLPTDLNPMLIIQDWGAGMTPEEVEAHYLSFGESTKTGDNDQIGGYGVGAKSPWAVTESFYIDTVKNGKRTVVQARRELVHQVTMSGVDTDLPNGTTISIPVKVDRDSDKWERIITEVASAHDQGAVTVNGKPISSIATGPARIGPVLCQNPRKLTRSYGPESVLIRSGGTLFDTTREIAYLVKQTVDLDYCVVELPIGSFDHTPSRESVTDTDRTVAAVKAALTGYKTEFARLAKEVNDLAKSDIVAAVNRRQEILNGCANYTVMNITAVLQAPIDVGIWTSSRRWEQVTVGHSDSIGATRWEEEMQNTIVITGVPAGKKLRTFATYIKNEHSYRIDRVIPFYVGQSQINYLIKDGTQQVTQTFPVTPSMVPDGQRYTWEQWLAATRVTSSGQPRGPRSGYDCHVIHTDGAATASQELTAAQILALGLPVWYEDDKYYSQRNDTTLGLASVGVILNNRKAETLLKSIPAAVTRHRWNTDSAEKIFNSFSDLERVALTAANSCGSLFKVVSKANKELAKTGSTFPFMDRIVEIADAIHNLQPTQREQWKAAMRQRQPGADAQQKIDALMKQLTSTWPLLATYSNTTLSSTEVGWIDYITQVAPRGMDTTQAIAS